MAWYGRRLCDKAAFSLALCCFAVVATVWGQAAETALDKHTTSGRRDTLPVGYAPPMVSNGSLCFQVDYQGNIGQHKYANMLPGIRWAGRRYEPPGASLIPFGYFENELTIDGKKCALPAAWRQTLDTQTAAVMCRNDYDGGVTAETTVFVPLDRDLIVVKRRLTTQVAKSQKVCTALRYEFSAPYQKNTLPRRVTNTVAWNDKTASADFRYQADGYRDLSGVISVFADRPATAKIDGQVVVLSCEAELDAQHPVEATFCLLFADSMDGKDYGDRADKLRADVRREGYAGVLAAQQQGWAKYWDQSYVRVPEKRLARVYRTAQYHLRANATRWSFPVGLFNTHWTGRYFGWDEMFCAQALITSNHLDISRRCPEFRRAGLKEAVNRNGHYGKWGKHGAHYPWITLEDGKERAISGFWLDHVFHMSNIAQSAWLQYQYTADADYLKETGYPIVKECARFYVSNMIYQTADGGMFIGKCTDLERLGPARLNPFMTSCGAIYTLEAAAQAAAILGADTEEAGAWRQAAGKLRESLPHNDGRYVPYAGCPEESIASLGGLFPYRLFDAQSTLQKNAAYWFVNHGQKSGNMYPVGKSLCAWYAGWLASALAILGDKQEPAKILVRTAEDAGCFDEIFEINEPGHVSRPWFSTAAGNVVFALNQMLVQCRDDRILLASAVPESWRDYAFKLACHGDLAVEVVVQDGTLRQLTLLPGDANIQVRRVLVLPEQLVAQAKFAPEHVVRETKKDAVRQVEVRFTGRTDFIAKPQ